MPQEQGTAARARQPQFVQRTSRGRLRRRRRQLLQLFGIASVLLYLVYVSIPLTGDNTIARLATNWDDHLYSLPPTILCIHFLRNE